MFRGNVVKDISLANSGGYIKSGKKKYSWELIYSLEKVMIDKSSFRNHVYLRLYQKAKKKYLGGWHDYSMHIPVDTRSAFPVISVQSPVSIQYRWQS